MRNFKVQLVIVTCSRKCSSRGCNDLRNHHVLHTENCHPTLLSHHDADIRHYVHHQFHVGRSFDVLLSFNHSKFRESRKVLTNGNVNQQFNDDFWKMWINSTFICASFHFINWWWRERRVEGSEEHSTPGLKNIKFTSSCLFFQCRSASTRSNKTQNSEHKKQHQIYFWVYFIFFGNLKFETKIEKIE